MDPHSARLVRDAIYELRHDHRTVILCTHNLFEAEALADRIAIIRQGRIIAQGTPNDLKQELLGQPLLEVKVDRPLNGQVKALEDLVTVEAVEGDTIRFRTPRPQTVNPQLVRRLHELGLGVITLQGIGRKPGRGLPQRRQRGNIKTPSPWPSPRRGEGTNPLLTQREGSGMRG